MGTISKILNGMYMHNSERASGERICRGAMFDRQPYHESLRNMLEEDSRRARVVELLYHSKLHIFDIFSLNIIYCHLVVR